VFGARALAEILRLDPVRDQQRIVFLTTRVDFPFDTTRALELALFRTFCVPLRHRQRGLPLRAVRVRLRAHSLHRPLRLAAALLARRARATALAWSPRRRWPLFRSQLRRATYPGGHRIDQVGPPQ
jgi:hypothetical protein